jgi:hypothetical protein
MDFNYARLQILARVVENFSADCLRIDLITATIEWKSLYLKFFFEFPKPQFYIPKIGCIA